MLSVGRVLRGEREKLKLSLEDIAKRTRISKATLQAIEDDNLSFIANTFYYESFVKQFAAAVRVDFTVLRPALESAAAEIPIPLLPGEEIRVLNVTALQPTPKQNGRWMPVLSLVAVLAACSVLYALSNRFQSSHSPAISQTPPTQLSADTKVEPKADNKAAPKTILLQVAAVEKTWLSLETDGRNVYSGLLEPTGTKMLEGKDSAKIRTGNAGGLAVTFNGKNLGVLGKRGEVQTVLFTPDRYEILQPGLISRLLLLPVVIQFPWR